MGFEDSDLTGKIIGAAFAVHRSLGSGFLEKVYENAMFHQLRKSGLCVLQQAPVAVRYDGMVVGEYFADLLVEGRIICELKSGDNLTRAHEFQLVNYLRATGLNTGLLIHFGDRIAIRRKFRTFARPDHPAAS
ncbi:MAG TPA: GxxExxY protein [Nevskiales bacterium]|nr:GxxExxY protein [Nevskiales bacterium]